MKKVALIMIALMLVCSAQSYAGLKKQMKKDMKVSLTPSMLKLSEKNGMVDVNFKMDVPEKFINKRTQYVLTPILTDFENVEKLPSIVITGKKFAKYLSRRGRGMSEMAHLGNSMFLPAMKDAQSVNYKGQFEFKPWMQNANLILDQRFLTRRNNVSIAEDVYAKGIAYTPEVVAVPVVVEPTIVTIMVNKMTGMLDLSFKINSSVIDLNLDNNMRELYTFKQLVHKIMNNNINVIDSVCITASSSPDGVYSQNDKLTKARAESVKNYLIKELGTPSMNNMPMVKAKNIAENWDMMLDLVKMNKETNVPQVLDIFKIKDLDQREAKMVALPQYNFIKKNILPELRFVQYEIFYKQTAVAGETAIGIGMME